MSDAGDVWSPGKLKPSLRPSWLRRSFVVAAIVSGSVAWLWQELPPLEVDPSSGRTRLGAAIPKRRFVALLNVVLWPARRWLVPLDTAAVLKTAQAWLGEELHDYGDLFDYQALNRTLAILDEKALPLARLGSHIGFSRAVAMHLRLAQLLKDHPEILREQIDRPLILTGPARSGTTFFHKAFSRAHHNTSDVRFVRLWEACAGPIELNPRRAHRRAYARFQVGFARILVSTLLQVHEWEDLDDPEEESQWLMASFSGVTVAIFGGGTLPLDDPHATARRARLVTVLMQVVQWQEGRRYRWVLKSPDHLYGLDHLLEELPSAKIVLLHRDPSAQVRSLVAFARIFHAGMGLDTSIAESNAFGLHLACTAQRKMAMETARLGPRALTIEGSQGVNGTIEALERVSEFAELPAGRSESAAAVLSEWTRREQRPSFAYDMLEYGLTDDQLHRCPYVAAEASPRFALASCCLSAGQGP